MKRLAPESASSGPGAMPDKLPQCRRLRRRPTVTLQSFACLFVLGTALVACSARPAPNSVTMPCIIDGKEVGTYTRKTNPDGTFVYVFSEGCSSGSKPSR